MINDRKYFDVSLKWRRDTDAWSRCANSSLSWVKHFPQTSPTLNKSSSHTSATDLFLTELRTCAARRLWILNANISHSFKCIFWNDFLLLIFFPNKYFLGLHFLQLIPRVLEESCRRRTRRVGRAPASCLRPSPVPSGLVTGGCSVTGLHARWRYDCLFIYSEGQTKHHIDRRLQLIIRNAVIYPPAFRQINMPSENISQMSGVFVHPCRALSAARGFTGGTWHVWSTGGTGPSQPLSRCRRSCVVTDFWGPSSRRWRSPALSPVQVKLQSDTSN